MPSSAKLQYPPLSILFFCSCDKVITNRKYAFFSFGGGTVHLLHMKQNTLYHKIIKVMKYHTRQLFNICFHINRISQNNLQTSPFLMIFILIFRSSKTFAENTLKIIWKHTIWKLL